MVDGFDIGYCVCCEDGRIFEQVKVRFQAWLSSLTKPKTDMRRMIAAGRAVLLFNAKAGEVPPLREQKLEHAMRRFSLQAAENSAANPEPMAERRFWMHVGAFCFGPWSPWMLPMTESSHQVDPGCTPLRPACMSDDLKWMGCQDTCFLFQLQIYLNNPLFDSVNMFVQDICLYEKGCTLSLGSLVTKD